MTAENDVILCVRCILYKKNIQKSLLALIHMLYCLDVGVGSQHHVRAATVHGDVARWDLEQKKQLRDLYFFIHGKKAMTL